MATGEKEKGKFFLNSGSILFSNWKLTSSVEKRTRWSRRRLELDRVLTSSKELLDSILQEKRNGRAVLSW